MKLAYNLLLFILTIGFFTACSKSDTSNSLCGENFLFYSAISDDVGNFSQAAIAYSEDPSEKNCTKYKASFDAYLSALEKWEDCAIKHGYTEDWKESIREAREDFKDFQCQ